ncbi:SNF2 family N-terminal domain-containing protein [Peziza echinospora]|nr:SNF2 family N-terminal domain-containing protein [Peziza echinospora]
MPVRQYPFETNPDEPTLKRQKTAEFLQTQTDVDDDDEDDGTLLPDCSDVPTLPMGDVDHEDATAPTSDVRVNLGAMGISQIFSSPPPPPTQPTQPMSSISHYFTPVVQVQASSPLNSPRKEDTRKQDVGRQGNGNGKAGSGGEVKPFSFQSSRALHGNGNGNGNGNGGAAGGANGSNRRRIAGAVDLTSDETPPYIPLSSDAESDNDIVPDFDQTLAAKAKVPSMKELKMRREMEENSASKFGSVDKVEESPIGIKNISRFAYQPPGGAPFAGARLDSIKSSASSYFTAGRGPQTRPDRAQPMVDLHLEDIRDEEMRKKVERIHTIAPHKSNKQILMALKQKKGNFDDAMDLLFADDDVVDLTKDPKPAVQTSKREARVPRKAITEKWSSTQARQRLPSSSPEVEVKPKRRLVKGGSKASRDSSPPAPIHIDDDDSSEHDSDDVDEGYEAHLETKVLDFINTCEVKDLIDIAATTQVIAKAVLQSRPYKNLDAVRAVSTSTVVKKGKGSTKRAVGDKVVDLCIETFRGYEAVDTLIKRCKDLGKPLAETIKSWGVDISGSSSSGELEMLNINVEGRMDSGIGTPAEGDDEDGDVGVAGRSKPHQLGRYMPQQPKNLGEGVVLKDYQLVGINWINMLYERKTSCILADEMGLGKTCQVVAFLAHLLTTGEKGPHLVVVPASTLENWLREFKNFCPSLNVEPYYGTQKERIDIRHSLERNKEFHVIVTTYNLATGDKNDRVFLKNMKFNVCVYDEGHMLKNSTSSRYNGLMALPAKFRLLLTGTPLQNNLQELASLLAFILPDVFRDKRDDLATIFKHKAKTSDEADSASNALLSVTRIQKAKAMMTPFVLRRKKQQVLGKHLPEKTTRVEYCELSPQQKEIYDEEVSHAKDAIEARANGKKPNKATSNLLMQLRKAAIHPFLFRRHFTNEKVVEMANAIIKEPAYRNNETKYIIEDMEVMNDFELDRLCRTFPDTLLSYTFPDSSYHDSGKIAVLCTLLKRFKENGDRVLIFSQFTQVMDILEKVLSSLDVTFLRLDGSTKVEDRQDMIDQFYDEEDISAFLLSTKAGGFGINLACANKVVIFDSSFNPHDDRQAADRAHRVGQKRPVEVINLVTRGTIEEQILALANTKLALDQSVSGEADASAGEAKGEEMVAKMMLGKV